MTCSQYEFKYNGKKQRCLGKNDDSRRVVRGGSWYNGPANARVSGASTTRGTSGTGSAGSAFVPPGCNPLPLVFLPF
ncbi:MAG: hypothetical protein DRR19_09230 [Candidatus Parabeggiatoa sp. nov. 1]|nr:MAG: hypothetical protein DRR19_09230 [Gammaproteobacteria bacterium]